MREQAPMEMTTRPHLLQVGPGSRRQKIARWAVAADNPTITAESVMALARGSDS